MRLKNVDWRRVAWIAGAILVVWFVVEIILAGREPTIPPPGSTPITLHGGHVTGNRISTRSWNFDYKSAQMSPDGTLATITGVRNGILYKKGKPYLSISAQQATINTQSFDFTATGDVHIAALNPKDNIPKTFDTDFVEWTNGVKMLMLSHPSIVHTGDQILKVGSISVNFNTNQVQMNNISGGIRTSK